jgi:hypothetical protein
MILFEDIIPVFDLPHHDVGAVCLVVALDHCGIGFTAVNGDSLGDPVAADRLRQKPQRRLWVSVLRQQKVDGLPGFIHGARQVAPPAFNLDVRLVHAPVHADRPLAVVERLLR